eukprot:scpid49622/ scgid15321/ 
MVKPQIWRGIIIEKLKLRCRVGGKLFSSLHRGTKYPIVEYKPEIRQCFGLNTESGLADVHPPFFCAKCMATIPIRDKRNLQQCPDTSNAGCGAAVVWEPHDKSAVCVVREKSKGGRPAKRSKASLSSATCTSHSVRVCSTSTPNGIDMPKAEFSERAAPRQRSSEHLFPSRMRNPLPSLLCCVCLFVADQCVESSCCTKLVCAECI